MKITKTLTISTSEGRSDDFDIEFIYEHNKGIPAQLEAGTGLEIFPSVDAHVDVIDWTPNYPLSHAFIGEVEEEILEEI